MGAATIGIQTIMPQTGTGPHQTPPPPLSGSDQNSNDKVAATTPQKPAPPPPGMGKYVDRLA